MQGSNIKVSACAANARNMSPIISWKHSMFFDVMQRPKKLQWWSKPCQFWVSLVNCSGRVSPFHLDFDIYLYAPYTLSSERCKISFSTNPPNAKSTDCRACLRTWYTPLANSAMMRSRWSPHEAACTLANHGPTWRASNTTIQSRMKRMRVLTRSHRANQATVRSTIQTIDVGGPLLFYVPPNKISCPVRHWIGGHCTSADLSRRSNKNISQG